jgi:hypothetical protein
LATAFSYYTYYFFNNGRAVEACWNGTIVDETPFGSRPNPATEIGPDGRWHTIRR